MRKLIIHWSFTFSLITAFLTAPQYANADTLRWASVDDLRVRSGPNSENKMIGILSRGAELRQLSELNSFCLIEGEGQYGWVACQYLSDIYIKRSKAGEDGIDSAQRWIGGNGVIVRDSPNANATIVARLSLNNMVKVLRENAEDNYCEVQLPTDQTGFIACRYLEQSPIVLAHLLGNHSADEAPSADYDPERAFWLQPSWTALEAYVEYLKQKQPDIPQEGPWPRNDALEHMKEHLAKGLKANKPDAYADWSTLKRKASQDLDVSGEEPRLRAQNKPIPEAVANRRSEMQSVASDLQHAIGIWGPLHDAISADYGAEKIVSLVRVLELPPIGPSFFHSELEIAPPQTSTEDAAGRFGIIYRQVVTPRPLASSAGLYDMLARTNLLVRSVNRVQLFRNGQLKVTPNLIRQKETLWREADEEECAGWTPGFAFGDADTQIWHYFELENPDSKFDNSTLNHNPVGSLFAFYIDKELPLSAAIHTESLMQLDRNTTGFVHGTYLNYDLNNDNIPDLVIWEGQGRGPGHLDGMTETDDRWYRLAFVNINGAWKILGDDIFGYGCGC